MGSPASQVGMGAHGFVNMAHNQLAGCSMAARTHALMTWHQNVA